MKRTRKLLALQAIPVAGLICLLLFGGVVAQTPKPISKDGLLEALRIGGLTTAELVREVQRRGVEFKLNRSVEEELRKAGAAPELIRAIGANYRKENEPVRGTNTGAPSLGLIVQDVTPQIAGAMALPNSRGVFVSTVNKDGIGDKAGVERRDVIIALNDVPVDDAAGLRRQLARLQEGNTLSLTVLRNGSTRKLNARNWSAKRED